MQTFLTSTDFIVAASQLDNARLGKQRVECLQILKALTQGPHCLYHLKYKMYLYRADYPTLYKEPSGCEWRKTPWYNHPAVSMWRGYEWPLVMYALEVCTEWIKRGYKDTCADKIGNLMADQEIVGIAITPDWLTEEFCSNHRSILLGKVWETYNQKAEWLGSAVIDYLEEDNFENYQRQFNKAEKVLNWYRHHNWTEKPAVKNEDGKWPYLWPS